MYAYAPDGPVIMRDEQPFKKGKENGLPKTEGPKYTILSISLGDCDLTCCLGPGISTIFVKKNEFPYDFGAFSNRLWS